jgi:glycosyltransferase involved in cell wall biosynthesis
MASGLPVLSYASAAAAQHIRHGYSGLLVEPFDEQRFVAAMRDALASPMRLVELGRRAREAVGPLRWDAVLADFSQALEQVASQALPAWPTVDVARAGDVARG